MTGWAPSCAVEIAARRAELLTRVRSYFAKRRVLAVDTPALGASTVTDPAIESFRLADTLYLQTSPEYFMKRLLASGYPDIYSICRVFRNAESGRRHLPEFTLVEWYRRGMELGEIISDAIDLIAAALDRAHLGDDVDKDDYCNVFQDAVGLDPLEASIDALARAAGADARLRRALGERRNAWLDLLMTSRVAPQFAPDRLTIVRHYPASQAALARLCPDDRRVADRFEVFYGSLELANGYVELTNAAEQAERMDGDRAVRRALGQPDVARDERLLAALGAGLGACAGVAVGLERLHMIIERTDDIRNVVTFS